MNKTVIIKYNAGNIRSVLFALERIGVNAIVTDDHEAIRRADRVIFPGVGEASSAMQYLQQNGLVEVIRSLTRPVLGICLGMQLMCAFSEENNTPCLGIFDQHVRRFPKEESFKVPQIGWNTFRNLQSTLLAGIEEDSFVYFVHGYYVESCNHAIATTEYIQPYTSAMQQDNFYAVQFHPEKSGDVGEQILRNFMAIQT